jgi:hypothetical protein
MWKLILVLAIWLYPTPDPSDYIILIADDCTNWGKIDPYRKTARYSLVKSTPDFQSIMLIHDWMLPEDSLSKINMRHADILEQNPRYTSELKKEDWLKLDNDKRKIYLLRPDEYCSRKRFVFNQQFTLYEVRVRLSGTE